MVVRQCQDGHLDAFVTLFSRYQQRVYDLACTIMRDEKTAEDVVQDTFLAIFQKIDGLPKASRIGRRDGQRCMVDCVHDHQRPFAKWQA